LGLSGRSGDVAELEASDDDSSRLALGVFAYHVAAAVGTMAVSLAGLDALAFTAGIGENSARVRREVCASLRFLGVDLEPGLNESASGDAEIASSSSRVRIAVVRAREELVAARVARALLGSDA
jgi:acetate kinase